MQVPHESIDAYIASFPPEVQVTLQKIRTTIAKAAPGATEKISYRMPTFYLYGNLVHFAAFKNHYGLFPTSSGIEHFKKELAGYSSSRGGVQFPFDRPVPYALITRIVKFRVRQNIERAGARKSK
jgi:uncharacterized protein YdhG (YjbR/CyaY superfamily)